MSVLHSLRTALGALGREPVLFLAGLGYALVVLPQNAAQLASRQFLSFGFQAVAFFVTPLFVAGLVGMAAEAAAGDTSLATFKRVGTGRYVAMLLAKFAELALMILFVIVVGITALVGTVLSLVVAQNTVLVAAVIGVVGLALAGVLFLIQFFPVAVVVDGTGVVESFKRSVRTVRENLLSALGYSVINVLVIAGIWLPVAGATSYQTFRNLGQMQSMQGGTAAPAATPGAGGFASAFQFSTQEVAALAAVSLAVTMLLFTFRQTFATAFYREHAPPVDDAPGATEAAGGAASVDGDASDDESDAGGASAIR